MNQAVIVSIFTIANTMIQKTEMLVAKLSATAQFSLCGLHKHHKKTAIL